METESNAAAVIEMLSLWHREALSVTTSSLILIFRSLISLKAEKNEEKSWICYIYIFFRKQNKILHGLSKWYSVIL